MTTRNRAIRFAEDELGVHTVFRDSVELEEKLRNCIAERTEEEIIVRMREARIEGRIIEVREKVRADSDSSISATAYESKVKDACASDEQLREYKEALSENKDRLTMLEGEIRGYELMHRSRIARMNELGGYLSYLAASRNASTAARVSVNDWPH